MPDQKEKTTESIEMGKQTDPQSLKLEGELLELDLEEIAGASCVWTKVLGEDSK